MKHLDETECFRDRFYFLNRTSLYPTHKEKSLNGLPSSYITDSLMLNDPSRSLRSLDISITKLFISIKILYFTFLTSQIVYFSTNLTTDKRGRRRTCFVCGVHESLESCWFMSDVWYLYATYVKPASHASEFEITD